MVTRVAWRVLCVSLLIAACSSGPPATATPSPMPTIAPPPSFVPLTEADCPVPAEIDEGAFRAAICPTIIAAVNAMRGRDVERLIEITTQETLDCAAELAVEPELTDEFPQCAGVPAPNLAGYVWCDDPAGPTCRFVGGDEYAALLRGLLEAADATATDGDGTGALRIIGFDACGGSQFLRATLISSNPELNDGDPSVRWVFDLLLRARPLFSDVRSDFFLIRRVDAGPIEDWREISETPLEQGRCEQLILWDASPVEGD